MCLLAGSMGLSPAYATESTGITATAPVEGFNYNIVVDVFLNEDGTVKEVRDAGTTPGSSNQIYWNFFVNGNGFQKFAGKSKAEIDSIDAVSNATITTNAAKQAVKTVLVNSEPETPEQPVVPKEKYPALTPGIKIGGAPVPGSTDSSRKFKVKVTVGADGRITEVKDGGSSVSFSDKKYFREYFGKFKGGNYFVGKTLKDVAEMDVYGGYGAHVPGSRGESSPYISSALGIRNAVLNALGYDYTMVEKDTDKTVSVVTNVARYNYEQRTTVRISVDGRVVSVTDNNTNEQPNYKTTDNLERINIYNKGRGYDKYVGKTLAEVKAMDVRKYGVDGVSGATYNATAVKQGVIKALADAGFDTNVEATPIGGRVFTAESTTAHDNRGSKVKIRAYISDDNRILKIEDNGSNPGETPWSTHDQQDSPWDKFVKYRGFAKFHGKSLEEVNAMNMSSVDSIDVAGRQTAISSAAREAVVAALNMAMATPTVNKDELKAEITKARDFLDTVEEGDIPGQYPEGTKTTLQAQITLAQNQVDNDSAREEDVNTAKTQLIQDVETAKSSVVPVVDKAELKAEIEKAKEFLATITEGDVPGEYPTGTKATLQSKIDAATTESQNDRARLVEVNATKTELMEAVEAAKATKIPVSDKAGLNVEIEKAKEFLETVVEGEEAGQYPEGTRDTLQAKIDTATAESNNDRARESEIEAVKSDLMKAVEAAKATVVKPLEMRELTSLENKVTVFALMSETVELVVAEIGETNKSEALENALKEDERVEKVLGKYEISVENGKYKAPLAVKFNVGEDANGKKMVIKHVKQNNEVESVDVTVENGMVSINVESLSPFAVAELAADKPDASAQPGDDAGKEDDGNKPKTDVDKQDAGKADDSNKTDTNKNVKSVKVEDLKKAPATGDSTDVFPVLSLLVAGVVGLLVTRRKFNK